MCEQLPSNSKNISDFSPGLALSFRHQRSRTCLFAYRPWALWLFNIAIIFISKKPCSCLANILLLLLYTTPQLGF